MRGGEVFDRASAVASIAILLILAGLSYFFAKQVERDAGRMNVPETTTEPDYFVEGMTLLRSDARGNPSVRVHAQSMRHRPTEKEVDFVMPHITTLHPERPIVEVTSDRGTGPDNGDRAELTGNVKVTRAPDRGRPAMTATMDHATVLIPQEIVITDAAVDIHQGQDWLSGTGMRLDSKARQLQLDSRVRGQFLAAPATSR